MIINLNILKNLFKKNYFFNIIKKIFKRFEKDTSKEALEWAKSNVRLSTDLFLKSIDKDLYQESLFEINKLEEDATNKLSSLKVSLGGGGNYLLLYFLVRKLKPKLVFETGVAAGWTTTAILRALKKNNVGKLFSSDFPYFRLNNPENYIGILAKEEKNIADWTLDIRGDDIALRNFVSKINNQEINIFHYDSDKSYSGRNNALNIVKNNLLDKSIIIFDDIQNNLHFKDLVLKNKYNFRVFEFNGKFVGLIGI